MDSKKKISLRHFANDKLKKDKTISHGDKTFYPVYLEIIYRRQHFQIKSLIDTYYTKEFESIDPTDRRLMKLEKQLIMKTIRFEESQLGDNHKLRGLGDRLPNYCAAVYDIVYDGLKNKLRKAIVKSKSEYIEVLDFEKENIPAMVLYRAAKSLLSDLGNYIDLNEYEQELRLWHKYFEIYPMKNIKKYRYPAFIHWMADDHYSKIKAMLIKDENIPEKVIEKKLSQLDTVVRLATKWA